MATNLKNLSAYDPAQLPDAHWMRVALVVAEWNDKITFALRDGAIEALLKQGVAEDEIAIHYVPGTFELTAGGKYAAKSKINGKNPDAVICIGCVIQGETPHFDYICQGVTQGITQLNLDFDIPFIFGVLTTDNLQQAVDRAGGKHGNKGVEAAITAIKMADLRSRLF